MININFDIFNLIFIFFELSIGFVLSVEMRKNFIINSQLKWLTLLNDV